MQKTSVYNGYGSERRLAAKLRGINSDVARRRELAEIYEEWFTSFAGAATSFIRRRRRCFGALPCLCR